jgi:SnoaL-like protein
VAAHPYRVAWQTRDLDRWAQALADDVVLHSPVIRKPFEGVQAARELFGVLFDVMQDLEITDELSDGEVHAFFWRATVAHRRIEGTDLIRTGSDGKISEIRVLIRPLVAIAAFAAGMGPALAARRSRPRALLVSVTTLPLRTLFALVDVLATRLIQRR